MNKNTKLILVVAVVGAGAYYVMNKRKQSRLSAPMMPTGPIAPVTPTFNNSINIQGEAGSQKGNWIGIPSSDRAKATAMLEIGTTGTINGTTPCTISEFWMDANGKKGAFKCEGQSYYEIPGGSTFKF
jgi:hypothetical protein|tara:strand:- start:5267 stop:5650 length:384 start_codon:yes stop_codon:yes gene_type:complete|eukprot:COSAG01_NODE_358_length_18285_cov_111.744089_15_plen_128_part_00